MRILSIRGLVAATLLTAAVGSAQTRAFPPGNYTFLPRTAAYDPQFDAWRAQIVADSFRVFDPSGAVFLVSVAKTAGDTLIWTDIVGPCTGVVSRYIVSRDSIGLKLDVVDDACADRAAALPNIYFATAKPPGDSASADRPRRYRDLKLFGSP